MSTIYVICPDSNIAYGGVKQLYRHVDALNKSGMDSCIVHKQAGFRCTWFHNQTRVISQDEMEAAIGGNDYLVFPEIYGPNVTDYLPEIRKVIFNQNSHYTFSRHSTDARDLKTPYLHPSVVATIVVSEHDTACLEYLFPRMNVFRVRYGLNDALFHYGADKQPQIAFMARKLPDDVLQVINQLKFRGALSGFELVEIRDRTEEEVAAILRRAMLFLSFSDRESFGLPPAEAMACGCIVVGYHGNGGREFLREPYAYPVDATNLLQFGRTVERVLTLYRQNPESLREQGRFASEFILREYSMPHEEDDVPRTWERIMEPVRAGRLALGTAV